MYLWPRRYAAFFVASAMFLCLFLCLSITAYAQTGPVTAPLPPLSIGVALMLALNLVLGFLTQAQQSGKILGQWSIPPVEMIVIGLVFPVISGFVSFMSGPGVVFNGTSITYGIAAGLAALIAASAPGVAVHAHFVVPAKMQAVRDDKAVATARAASVSNAVKVAGGLIMMALVGCASFAQFIQAIQAGQAAIVPATNLACEIAVDVDPTGATAICAQLDAAGNVVSTLAPVVEDAASIAALVANTKPKTPVVAAAVSAAHVAFKKGGGK
jgi:hypothetical protein